MKILSDEYKRVLVSTHAANKGWGSGGKGWGPVVETFANDIGAMSILDYGCGQGSLKKVIFDRHVREYDPGIVGKDAPPSPADLVVCTDVLEHIEPEYVGATLTHIRTLARIGMFAVIALSPAKLILTDGRNAHLTVRSVNWWLNELHHAGFIVMRHSRPKALCVWSR